MGVGTDKPVVLHYYGFRRSVTFTMAACPECGSSQILATQNRKINWGRAIGGWLLFGPIGGAVGSLIGETKQVVFCVDCGRTWAPSDLRRSLTVIQRYTGKMLNLEQETDRWYLRDFILEIEPVILEGVEAERRATSIYKLADSASGRAIGDVALHKIAKGRARQEFSAWGAALGFGIALILLFFGILSWDLPSFAGAMFLIALPLWFIGSIIDTAISTKPQRLSRLTKDQEKILTLNRASILEKADKRRTEADAIRKKAEDRFANKLAEFMSSHP